ncbi:hypothetical protein XFF6166_80084 [Xanthomonas citri pv. fuscans]|nr:hypothetical protein XFF6166_80084 [Xanthomonas citri pv. fuscans]SON99756.1 hypothetical protein XFF6960_200030 [Xanthomonas citri pv. fuscans]SOO03201.1 hypothetical protein XFF7767_150083 [Xanthomonas citri pv. fuscans]SOO09248.1 hypothetical protein XFF6970_330030 [Xanthomonas citri pv. fuscans]SOO15658.1 hypothetical protein XFF7766_600083 [Xanthomonas citri pv. fuscans]
MDVSRRANETVGRSGFGFGQRVESEAESVAGAVPSPLAGHAVNPSMGARWRHPCRQRSRKR